MKTLRKLIIGLLTICLLVFGASETALAAGAITFSDPETTVGATFTLKGKVDAAGEALSKADIVISFDPAAIRFVSGDHVTPQGDNQLAISIETSGTSIEFTMEFIALTEGETKIDQVSETVIYEDGSTVGNLEEGHSVVKIGPGDPSLIPPAESAAPSAEDGTPVMVGDQQFVLSNSFDDTEIPPYFTNSTITFEGNQYKGAILENGTLSLGYLINQANEGRFFVFDEAVNTFSPFEQISISEKRSIVILQDDGEVNLPSHFEEVKVTVNGNDFPAWQDMEREGFYVIYAVNNDGVKGFYQFDAEEETYQRFSVDYERIVDNNSGEVIDDSTFFGKIVSFLKTHFNYALIGVGFLLLLLLILLLIVGVKLHNRNAEIDDLYDEFGLDDDGAPMNKKAQPQVTSRKAASQKPSKYDDDEYDDDDDEFEEYDDDEYDDDEYDDEYDDDDDYDDDEYDDEDYDDDEYDDEDYDDEDYDYDDDDEFEEYEDDEDDDYIEPVRSTKKSSSRSSKKGDDFSMDFIDL